MVSGSASRCSSKCAAADGRSYVQFARSDQSWLSPRNASVHHRGTCQPEQSNNIIINMLSGRRRVGGGGEFCCRVGPSWKSWRVHHRYTRTGYLDVNADITKARRTARSDGIRRMARLRRRRQRRQRKDDDILLRAADRPRVCVCAQIWLGESDTQWGANGSAVCAISLRNAIGRRRRWSSRAKTMCEFAKSKFSHSRDMRSNPSLRGALQKRPPPPAKKCAVATAICSLSRFESAPTIVRIDGQSPCVFVAHTYEANVSKCVMHQKASARLVCVCLIVCNKCKHIAITRTRYVIVTIIVRVNCTWAETQLLLACVVWSKVRSTHANDHDGRFLLVSRVAGGWWTRPMVLYAPIYCKSISAIWAPESFVIELAETLAQK